MGLSDQKIVELIKNDSGRAYKHLNKHYFPKLKKYVLMNSGTFEDAKDLYQDVLTILHLKIKKEDFKLTSELYTFFFGIVKRQWMLKLRNRKIYTVEFDEEEHTLEEDPEGLELELAKYKNYQLFRKHVEKLNKRCQTILILHFDKKKWDVIAKAIGTTSQSFVWRLTSECKAELVKSITDDPAYPELKKIYDELTKEL